MKAIDPAHGVQRSIPEDLLDDLKSAIDAGDDRRAMKRADDLKAWSGAGNDTTAMWVEKWRTLNETTAKSSVFETTALNVLDYIIARDEGLL